MICSGEALPAELREPVCAAAAAARLHNLYGPTEASIDVTLGLHAATARAMVPIGRPIWNTRLYVLDAGLSLCRRAWRASFTSAGLGLARGYLNRAGADGGAVRRRPAWGGRARGCTGPGTWRAGAPTACWSFSAARDAQVKLRGFRIELGEIEAALRAAAGVCAGRGGGARRMAPAASKRLVGYVVAAAAAARRTWRRCARRFGAAAGLHGAVGVRGAGALPLTPNGKLDRRALPAPELRGGRCGGRRGRPREEVLCALFAEVLGVERVGIDDNSSSSAGTRCWRRG